MANLDRQGNERCTGYRKEDFQECQACQLLETPAPQCSRCGGYGEYPKVQELPA